MGALEMEAATVTPPRAANNTGVFDRAMLRSGHDFIRLRRGFKTAVCLLASTVLTMDRIITPKQKHVRRRLLREASLLGKRGIL